jgi:hypothetical protein
MMSCEWADSLTEQCERVLDIARESRQREHEINAAWRLHNLAQLVKSGYRINPSAPLTAALKQFEDFHE